MTNENDKKKSPLVQTLEAIKKHQGTHNNFNNGKVPKPNFNTKNNNVVRRSGRGG